MDENPLVSIIVVTYNGQKYLKSCFESLMKGFYKNIEIILVDNGSDDGSYEFVKENFPNVKTIPLKENLGLSIASNFGAAQARGKYLFFYNNDTIADENLILKLIQRAESDKEIGICGCRTLTYDGKKEINCGVPMDIFGYPYGFGKPFYVDAAIFIRKNVFEEIGGFDGKLFLYGEDRDLCWRVRLYGYKVAVVPDAIFFHDSTCIDSNIKNYSTNIKKRYLGEFNALRSILKHYSSLCLLAILPIFMLINFFEMFAFALSGNLKVVKEVYLKSYRENSKLLKDTLRLRKKVQNERRISDFYIMKDMQKISGKLLLLFKMGIPKVS